MQERGGLEQEQRHMDEAGAAKPSTVQKAIRRPSPIPRPIMSAMSGHGVTYTLS